MKRLDLDQNNVSSMLDLYSIIKTPIKMYINDSCYEKNITSFNYLMTKERKHENSLPENK